MSFPMRDGRGPLPDSRRELIFILAALGVAAVIVTGATLVYVQQNPGAPWQLEAMYGTAFSFAEDSTVTAESTLVLPVSDAEYLNRAYRDLNTRSGDRVGEQAYCLDLVNGRLSVQQAGTIEGDEDRLTFTTDNCLFAGSIAGTAHLHPPYSEPVLSGPDTAAFTEQNDKQAFLDSEYQLSCVMAGLTTTVPGERTRALRCYTRPESEDIDTEFPEIPIVIGS